MEKTTKSSLFILWFRKNLRIHDQPLLKHALKNQNCTFFLPLYIIRESFIDSKRISANRLGFLLESVADLNFSLQRRYNHKLVILRGSYLDSLRALVEHICQKFPQFQNNISLGWETSLDPEISVVDGQVNQFCTNFKIKKINFNSRTLWNFQQFLELKKEKPPHNMSEFLELVNLLPPPEKPVSIPQKLSPPIDNFFFSFTTDTCEENRFPGLLQIKLSSRVTYYFDSPRFADFASIFEDERHSTFIEGGEKNALKIFNKLLKNPETVLNFKKSRQNPTSLRPQSSLMSPFLNLGCLSVRHFHFRVTQIHKFNNFSGKVQESLLGQLYWREFFHVVGSFHYANITNEKKAPSPEKRPNKNKFYVTAWQKGQTGFPAIGKNTESESEV